MMLHDHRWVIMLCPAVYFVYSVSVVSYQYLTLSPPINFLEVRYSA